MTQVEEPEVVYVNPDGTIDGEEEARDESSAPTDHKGKGRGRFTVPWRSNKWSEELMEEARKAGIEESDIAAGGDYRLDEKGGRYWLPLDQLVEFEQADQRLDDDKEFWAWFRDFRDKHKIGGQEKKGWRSYLGDYQYKDSNRNYMSGWWSSWGYNTGSEINQRLAIALGAVQSIVSVINDTGKRFRVQLATEDNYAAPTSYTSFDDHLVVVSPQALLDTSLSQDKGIEVTAGWALHEGSHVRYTGSKLPALRAPTELTPLSLASYLMNVAEDILIEAQTSESFPGFAGYFDRGNEYLWSITKDFAPKEWGPELGDKMNAITAIVKWPNEFKPIVDASTDAQLKAEFDWFHKWAEEYKAGKDLRQALVDALLHLQEDPKTKEQMQQQSNDEKAQGAGRGSKGLNDKQFRDFLKELRKGLKNKNGVPAIEPCPSPERRGDHKIKLTPEQSKEVEKLLREELKRDTPVVVRPGDASGNTTQVTSFKPEETPDSKAAYRRPSGLVSRMKTAFVFRKTAPEWADRLQRTGSLDEDVLWRLAGNDLRVFERKITKDTPDTQVTMLVDMSGSMIGAKILLAEELATVMLECLRTMRGVRVRVRGHTTLNQRMEPVVYRLWEPGDPVTRLGLIGELHHGWNHDGYAIDWCARELVETQRPGEDMVLIVLSDGIPNAASGYSGMPAMQHVRQVTDSWAKRGVTTIQLAIDPSVEQAHQAIMYRNWIPYESRDKLPAQLTRLLIKLFGGVSN